MRLISWNIQHGGGKRAPAIIERLGSWSPDLVVMNEFRGTAPSQTIAASLRKFGLSHQVNTVNPDERTKNGVLVASRWPLRQSTDRGILSESGRWVRVVVETLRPFSLVGMHVPNRDHGKYPFQEAVVEALRGIAPWDGIAAGDTNTGRKDADETSPFFNDREDAWFDQLGEMGWQDIFRVRNPGARVFSWFTHSGSGFRLDQAFVTRSMASRVGHIEYVWGENGHRDEDWPSDHAAMVVEIDE